MNPPTFYEVPNGAYLFRECVGSRAVREEPVRQWCAHELIRCYGIPATRIEFESQIRIGSKKPRIDILISRKGKPWIVVECKERAFRKHDDGISQARSYANAHGVHAEFIVYTNGDVWLVERRRGNEWIRIPDLPRWEEIEGERTIVSILTVVKVLRPLLHGLDGDVSGERAIQFLCSMQVFFSGFNLLTISSDKNLLDGLDNLLRAVAMPSESVGYRTGKLACSHRSFEKFSDERGLEILLPHVESVGEFRSELHSLNVGIGLLLDCAEYSSGESVLLLRLCKSLADFGLATLGAKKRSLRIGAEIHRALRDFLDHVVTLKLGTSLPLLSDKLAMRDMRSSCEQEIDMGGLSLLSVLRLGAIG